MKNQFYPSAKVNQTSDTSVEIMRSFRAPKELVYRAYTEPTLLKRWMLGPPGWEMVVCEMDLKEGGKFHLRWRHNGNGSEFGFLGVYQKIEAQQQIAYRQIFDPGTLGGDMGREFFVAEIFHAVAEHTTVTTRMEFPSEVDMKLAVSTGMTDGMEMSYQNLDKLIEQHHRKGMNT